MTKLLITFVALTCGAALIGCHKKNRGGGGIYPRGSTSVSAPIPTAPPAPNVPPPEPQASPTPPPSPCPSPTPSVWSIPSSPSDSSRSTSPETPIWIDQERDES